MAKRIDLDTGRVVALYEAGASVGTLAEQFKCSTNTIRRQLQGAGVRIRPQRLPLDVEAIAAAFNAGTSVKALAEQFGCARNVIVTRLEEVGITPRGRSESMYLRMEQTSPEERQRLTGAAHDAVRGRTVGAEERAKRVLTRFANDTGVSPTARALYLELQKVGLYGVTELPAGTYNIDIAIVGRKLAIEVNGGGWHAWGHHADRRQDRIGCLNSQGWTVVEVWNHNRRSNLPAVAARIAAIPRERDQPSLIVLTGDGEDAPPIKSYLLSDVAVDDEARRCADTGRYMRAKV